MLRFGGKIASLLVGTVLMSAVGVAPVAAAGSYTGSYGSMSGYGSAGASYSQNSSSYGGRNYGSQRSSTYGRRSGSMSGYNSYYHGRGSYPRRGSAYGQKYGRQYGKSYGNSRSYCSNTYGGSAYGSNAYGNMGGSSYGSGNTIAYWVMRGDTLRGIAARFGTSIAAILAANPGICDPDLIYAGAKLMIPAGPGYGQAQGYGNQKQAPAQEYGNQNQAPAEEYGNQAQGQAPAQEYGNQNQAPQPAPAPAPAPKPGQQVMTIDLTASNMAFSTKTITVPAGARVVVRFNNQDALPHNFALYMDRSAQQAIFQGQILMGPAVTTYAFNAPGQAGTYFFRCDVHPAQMNGQFVVQ